ncbi:hypothetical protein F4680DRAFT_131792 [Xylaria scruposa]|nr:hypothetical protein F4680DRAFT_131792 [Xylaria scruposa]
MSLMKRHGHCLIVRQSRHCDTLAQPSFSNSAASLLQDNDVTCVLISSRRPVSLHSVSFRVFLASLATCWRGTMTMVLASSCCHATVVCIGLHCRFFQHRPHPNLNQNPSSTKAVTERSLPPSSRTQASCSARSSQSQRDHSTYSTPPGSPTSCLCSVARHLLCTTQCRYVQITVRDSIRCTSLPAYITRIPVDLCLVTSHSSPDPATKQVTHPPGISSLSVISKSS